MHMHILTSEVVSTNLGVMTLGWPSVINCYLFPVFNLSQASHCSDGCKDSRLNCAAVTLVQS